MDFDCRVFLDASDLQVLNRIDGGLQVTKIEWSELGIACRGRIEAHCVHDILDRFWISAPQRDAPFPVIKAGRSGNQLADSTRELDPARCML